MSRGVSFNNCLIIDFGTATTFDIVKNSVDDFVLVSEEKIEEGIRLNFHEHRLVTEGAAATSVMVVKDDLSKHLGKNIICLICGGNIDTELFSKIIL